jgi:hypothetical protein
MRAMTISVRLLLVLAIGAGLGVFGSVGCGGPDKPPLTPDTDTPNPEGIEAGPPPSSPSAPSK